MGEKKDIVIVGAGIIGFSTAYYLSKQGYQVTILDNTDGTDNCSYGNAGYVSPSHFVPLAAPGMISQGMKWMFDPESPFYIKPSLDFDMMQWGLKFKAASTQKRVDAALPVMNALTVQSKHLYEQIIADEQIVEGYVDKGLLLLCKTKHVLEEEAEVAHLGEEFGLKTSVLTAEQAMELDPGIEFDVEGAVYFEDDACMTPHIFMKMFRSTLEEMGVEIKYGTEVTDIKHKSGRIQYLRSKDDEIYADEYIITAGTWTNDLLKPLGINLPLQAGKGYSFLLQNPIVKPTIPSILVEGRIATTPMIDGFRIAGTMELTGKNHDINQRRVNGIIKNVSRFLPQFREQNFDDIKPWAGLRPVSPDGLPYIGRSQKVNNLLVGTGHAMLGWTLGPITGHLLAQEVIGEKPDITSELLAVERYN